MEPRNKKTDFMEKFEHYSGNRFDVCYDIYLGLMDNAEEDRLELLTYACNNFGIKDSDGSFLPKNSQVSKDELDGLKELYGNTVDTLLDALVQKGIKSDMAVSVFYDNIWNLIVQNPIFPTEKEKVFALYYILIDSKIPYYSITPGLAMNNSEYQSISEECNDDIQKARFVLAVDFPQKTMEASNLLDIILSQPDYNRKVLILSKIVAELRRRNKDLLDSLIDKIKEEE